jgi:hypothetical protein
MAYVSQLGLVDENALQDAETIIQKALGAKWDLKEDAFVFELAHLKEGKDPKMKRQSLSLVASVFDPMSFIAPNTLKPKKALQNMCTLGLGLDNKVPDSDLASLIKWKESLDAMFFIKIPRCLRQHSSAVKNVQLHHFSDASEIGYGSVTYIRYEDLDGNVKVAFLLGKSRETPLKHITIPRLELQAAVCSIESDIFLKDELDMHIDNTYFWTDSSTALRYLSNRSTRFKTYVANRVTKILDNSKVSM